MGGVKGEDDDNKAAEAVAKQADIYEYNEWRCWRHWYPKNFTTEEQDKLQLVGNHTYT